TSATESFGSLSMAGSIHGVIIKIVRGPYTAFTPPRLKPHPVATSTHFALRTTHSSSVAAPPYISLPQLMPIAHRDDLRPAHCAVALLHRASGRCGRSHLHATEPCPMLPVNQ